MIEAAAAKHGIDLGKEVVRGVLWLANRRALARNEMMQREIVPLYNEMRQSHDDFRYILSRLDQALEGIGDSASTRSNDIDDRVAKLDAILNDLRDRRDIRRSDRPGLRKSAEFYRQQLEARRAAEKLVITDKEFESAVRLFGGIASYLTNEDGKYGHELPRFIQTAGMYLRMYRQGADLARLPEQIERLRQSANAYGEDREARWVQMAEAFGSLSASIGLAQPK